MHGKLIHVETSPLHLLKPEWQGDTRPETKVHRCTSLPLYKSNQLHGP